MTELLRIDNLSAGYGEAVVLNDISFSLGEGETLALLGRNGTGKTTLMDTLAGATRQHGGQIFLGGQPLHSLPSHGYWRKVMTLSPSPGHERSIA